MRKFKEMQVYEYVDEATARRHKEGKIVDATWVDDRLKQKSRLVAREFARGEERDDLFSPTPSLLATKLLLSECASGQHPAAGHEPKRMMVLDVKRAFLYGLARRRIYLRLPKEDPRSRER